MDTKDIKADRAFLPYLLIALFFLITYSAAAQYELAAHRAIKVACVGNSVTYGAGISGRDSLSYPAQLQKMLGEKYVVRNFGHSGASLLKKGFKPYYKTEEFFAALSFRPDIAVIHLGLNDTDPRAWPNYRDEFIGDYLWLVDTLKSVGAKEIYIAKMSPIFQGHRRFKAGTRDWYREIEDAIEETARISGVVLIDFNTPLRSRPDLMPDNLHPTACGAKLLARVAYSAVTGDYGGLALSWGWSDNMVLQRGKPITLAGKADRGENVTVSLNRNIYSTTASMTGDWSITIEPLLAGGPYTLYVTTPFDSMKINNILCGEVWFCSGQSNMEWNVANSEGAEEALSNASDDGVRLLHFERKTWPFDEPWDSLALTTVNELKYFSESSWKPASSEDAGEFSAVAYYFGERLRKELGVPVGIIEMTVGGSPAEAWIGRKALETDSRLVDLLYDYRKSEMNEQWVRNAIAVTLKLTDNPLQRHPFEPAYLYESGITHLAGFPIRGFLWYQGESNAHFPELHEEIFPTLVENWRRSWGDENLPFYYAQLSSFDSPSWPVFRESQRRLQNVIPHSGMVVTSDIGDRTDIHPRNKKTVGERFALLAMGDIYGKKGICRSPEPVKAEYKNSLLVITFTNAGKLDTSDGKVLRELETSTSGSYFKPAKGKIRRNKIIINAQGVVAVRYGWKPYSEGNLVNKTGLPASTFNIEVR
mgnify:CR=1 FL=1